jgi:hypothetical protein
MVLRVPISPKTQAKLKAKAAALGLDVESYASQQLDVIARRPTLVELSGPIANAFQKSGMTEEEWGNLLEQEKHAMRAERQAKRGK